MAELFRLALALALVASICGGLLAFVGSATQKARDDAAGKKLLDAARNVLPQRPGAVLREDNGFFILEDGDGGLVAAAVEGSSQNGYGGEIRILAAFMASGEAAGFAVLEAKETPGLGAKISEDGFRNSFKGKSSPWRVKKDGGEIDAITSATISSRAVCEAMEDAFKKFDAAKRKREGN